MPLVGEQGLPELGSQGEVMGFWCLPRALAHLNCFPGSTGQWWESSAGRVRNHRQKVNSFLAGNFILTQFSELSK